MKKVMAVLVILIMVLSLTSEAFASAKKPDFNTKYGCYQRPTYECKQFNPWFWTGGLVGSAANMEKFNACAKPIYAQCDALYPKSV